MTGNTKTPQFTDDEKSAVLNVAMTVIGCLLPKGARIEFVHPRESGETRMQVQFKDGSTVDAAFCAREAAGVVPFCVAVDQVLERRLG